MACSSAWRMARSEWRNRWNYSPFATPYSRLHSRHIELRLLAGAVAAQRALLADRVGTLEDPVLPGGEAGEDFRFHRLRPDEAEVRFHAGQAVGREGSALLEEHAYLVIPVDVVEREGDEAKLLGLVGVDRLTHFGPGAIEVGRVGLEAGFEAR